MGISCYQGMGPATEAMKKTCDEGYDVCIWATHSKKCVLMTHDKEASHHDLRTRQALYFSRRPIQNIPDYCKADILFLKYALLDWLNHCQEIL